MNSDPVKFRGGGYVQLTGRYNYQKFLAPYLGESGLIAKNASLLRSLNKLVIGGTMQQGAKLLGDFCCSVSTLDQISESILTKLMNHADFATAVSWDFISHAAGIGRDQSTVKAFDDLDAVVIRIMTGVGYTRKGIVLKNGSKVPSRFEMRDRSYTLISAVNKLHSLIKIN
jgi:hypothetical protein